MVSIKDLENDVLKLGDRLKPLSTSYTQTGNPNSDGKTGDGKDPKEEPVDTNPDEGGRPAKKDKDKADKTIENEKSLDKTGGGS